jgi:hypothetical protein
MDGARRSPAALYWPAVRRQDSAAVESRIVSVRDQRVILSPDLAAIHGVETRVLLQAVKRNQERFPPDFAFRLTRAEVEELRTERSQPVIFDRSEFKHLPMAFTEHGAVMAATVLSSPRAVQMSIYVVRAFVRMRAWFMDQAELSQRLASLEQKVGIHDEELAEILAALRELVTIPGGAQRRIGFEPEQDD